MSQVSIQVSVVCAPGVRPPTYADVGASGVDLRAYVADAVTLAPWERRLVSTGLSMSIPIGYEAQIRSRSGLALNHGVVVLNSPGTIDSSYRGVVQVLLWNSGAEPFIIEPNMRIAQCVFAPVTRASWQEVAALVVDTERGMGGFGSTGVS